MMIIMTIKYFEHTLEVRICKPQSYFLQQILKFPVSLKKSYTLLGLNGKLILLAVTLNKQHRFHQTPSFATGLRKISGYYRKTEHSPLLSPEQIFSSSFRKTIYALI